MPVSGKVLEINNDLNNEPTLLNTDPFENGWMLKVQLSDNTELDKLFSVEQYKEKVEN
ncbi:glycine cleavage system protein H [Flavobacterium sp. ZS1P14]|uniref:glycine cleavage system protein H n=1 Tax=Flavobacterium sp. ZS1P14 TaxID=3401729 RepID=UPI003AAD75D0